MIQVNHLIQQLCECTENKTPSGRVMNEIREIINKLKTMVIKPMSNHSLLDIFFNYNIILAEDLSSSSSVNTNRLEQSLLSYYSLNVKATKTFTKRRLTKKETKYNHGHISNCQLQIVNSCKYLIQMSPVKDVDRNILPVWLLASFMMKQGRWDVALAILKNSLSEINIVQDHSGSIETKLPRVLSKHCFFVSLGCLGLGDIICAKQYALKSLTYDPNNHNSISLIAYIIAKFDGTISEAKTWSGRVNSNSFASDSLGYAMAKLGFYRESISLLRHSLSLDLPNESHTMYNLAIIYGRNGDMKTMQKILHLLCESLVSFYGEKPYNNNDMHHQNKPITSTSVKLNMEDVKKIEQSFSIINVNNYQVPYGSLIYNMCKYMLGRLHALNGNWTEACVEYNQVRIFGVDILPSTEFHCNFATALLGSNKPIEAMNLLTPIYLLDPSNPDIGEVMIEIYIALNKPKKALAIIQNILANQSKMSTERKCRLYNNAAMLLTCVGKYAEAIDSVNKAISISKHKAVEAVFNRSFLYIRIGNLKEAAVTWLTHRDINVAGDEHYYRNQIKRLVTISNRVEDGTKIFCEGKVDFKQLIAMDLFSCNCLLEKCV